MERADQDRLFDERQFRFTETKLTIRRRIGTLVSLLFATTCIIAYPIGSFYLGYLKGVADSVA